MIRVENVSKEYLTRRGPRRVLDNINLEVAPGERIGILGLNGAGKSTLVRIISGAELPTKGRVIRAMSVSWPLAFSGGFQGSLTGFDNLRFVCRIYGADFKRALPFVEEFTELGRYFREPVKKYSAGMLSRLAFALSLAVEFDCYLIDEIIAVGDRRFHDKCKYELFEKRKDKAMILVTHAIDFIRAFCRRACVLKAGKMQMFEKTEEAIAYYIEEASRAPQLF